MRPLGDPEAPRDSPPVRSGSPKGPLKGVLVDPETPDRTLLWGEALRCKFMTGVSVQDV